MVAASGLDRLAGDPRWCVHPVQLMGAAIGALRQGVEAWAADSPWKLRWGGALLAALVVAASAAAGWALEQLLRISGGPGGWPGLLALGLVVVGLASALAGRSLRLAVEAVLEPLALEPPDLPQARQRLAWIVGRDVQGLPRQELLRAAAETASENAVDGLFAPLFWMLLGAFVWGLAPQAPGPLAFAWAYKASSTLDSMLGYRTGRLRWLGSAGARLDDLLTWLPCRLTALSLGQLARALADGASDPSPNAGVSEAAYAHAVGVQLGGANYYGGELRQKPLLNAGGGPVTGASVQRMLGLSQRTAFAWLALASGLAFGFSQGQGAG
ncbi:MAG: Cobalamin biosynthesis protein CobD/CbiB [Cyanobacteriota bacterium]